LNKKKGQEDNIIISYQPSARMREGEEYIVAFDLPSSRSKKSKRDRDRKVV